MDNLPRLDGALVLITLRTVSNFAPPRVRTCLRGHGRPRVVGRYVLLSTFSRTYPSASVDTDVPGAGSTEGLLGTPNSSVFLVAAALALRIAREGKSTSYSEPETLPALRPLSVRDRYSSRLGLYFAWSRRSAEDSLFSTSRWFPRPRPRRPSGQS